MTSLVEVCGGAGPVRSEGDRAEFLDISVKDVIDAVAQSLHPSKHNKDAQHPSQQQPAMASFPPWTADMQKDGFAKVLDRNSLLDAHGMFTEDHWFKAMCQSGMVEDNIVLFRGARPAAPQQPPQSNGSPDGAGAANPEAAVVPSPAPQAEVVNVYKLGAHVCGHAGIVHGGLSAAIFDETAGYVLYLARKSRLVDFVSVLTAHLEMDYKKPLRANGVVTCAARIESLERRKIWVSAEICDRPGGEVYAVAKALFIIPRTDSDVAAATANTGAKLQQQQQQQEQKDEGNEADV